MEGHLVIVQPELSSHPKFRRLKRRIGEGAAELLLNLWGHCQQNQRGEFWPKADVDYVEAVCGWNGEAGKLFEALVEQMNGRPGWIEVEEGGVRIHDWGQANAQLIQKWKGGRNGGRPKKNRTETDRLVVDAGTETDHEPSGVAIDRLDRGSGESVAREVADASNVQEKNEAHIPSVEEVIGFGESRLADRIPDGYCRHFHRERTKGNSWVNGAGRLRKWELDIVDWWRKDCSTWGKKTGAAQESAEELLAQLEKETDRTKRTALRERIRVLETNTK